MVYPNNPARKPIFGNKKTVQQTKVPYRTVGRPQVAQRPQPPKAPLPKKVEKKGNAKKIIASVAVLLVAILAIIIVLLLGSSVQEEVVQKTALLIPFIKNKKK